MPIARLNPFTTPPYANDKTADSKSTYGQLRLTTQTPAAIFSINSPAPAPGREKWGTHPHFFIDCSHGRRTGTRDRAARRRTGLRAGGTRACGVACTPDSAGAHRSAGR